MGLFLRFSLYLSYFIPLYKLKTMDTQTLSCQAEINWLPSSPWKNQFWYLGTCKLNQILLPCPNSQFSPIFNSSRFLQYLATTFQTNFSNLSAFCLVASLRTIAWLSMFFLGLLVALLLAICPRTRRRSGSWSSIAWYKAWGTIHHRRACVSWNPLLTSHSLDY